MFKKQFEEGEPSINSKPVQDFFTEFDHYLESKKSKVVKDVIKDYNSLRKHLEGFQEFSGIIIDFNAFDVDLMPECLARGIPVAMHVDPAKSYWGKDGEHRPRGGPTLVVAEHPEGQGLVFF